jgi:hypothetical protein
MKFEKDDLVKLYINMVRAEAYDQWLYRKSITGEMKATYHPVWGDFAAGVGGCTFLRPDDVICPHLRGHGLPHIIGKGLPMKRHIADQPSASSTRARFLMILRHWIGLCMRISRLLKNAHLRRRPAASPSRRRGKKSLLIRRDATPHPSLFR